MDRVKRIFRESMADNITGESAKVAFYLFLSLFPLILVVFALTGFLGGERAFVWIMDRIQATMPETTAGFLEGVVREITTRPNAGALGIGLVLTLWSATGGMAALADSLSVMFDVTEPRSFIRQRLVALALLLASVVLVLGGAVAILAGPAIAEALGLGPVAELLLYPLALVLVVLQFWLIYYFLPNREARAGTKWKALAGAAIGAVVWVVVTAGFRLYVGNFGNYTATYGAIGAVIVLMLWLYLTALAILFGGEVASVLEGARDRWRREAEARRRAA